MNVIDTTDLTKSYGQARGMIDINLSVAKGEVFGLIGPNGAGKSTLLRTLLGLLHPTSGSARIFGKDIVTSGPQIRQQIGYLPSEVFYYDRMRVGDLLRYSASFYAQPARNIAKKRQELADLLQLDMTQRIDDLSYGNKKKVGIIQGLQHSPRLIILDEPTGGLDPLMQQTFFELLQRENAAGATVLFSSHILSEVQKLCNRVAIIREGRIVTVETMEKLRQNHYARVHLELAQLHDTDGLRRLHHAQLDSLHIDGAHADFIYRGDSNRLMALLAGINLKSAFIEEPELEEIFMQYYQQPSLGQVGSVLQSAIEPLGKESR